MRIALVSNSLPPEPATRESLAVGHVPRRGGAQAYVADLATALAERHDVLVLSGAHRHTLPADAVRVVRLPSLRRLLPDEPRTAKVGWHLRDQWMPSVHSAALAALRDFAPDVVHSHQPQGLSAAPFTAIARLGLPHVHTVHDLNLLCVRVSMTREGEPCGRRCAPCLLQRAVRGRAIRGRLDRLISPSDCYRALHVRAGIVAPEAAVTIRQGAEPGTARRRGRPVGPLTLGMIGALAPHKGVGTMLDAFRAAPPDWRLHVAGSGPLEEAVRAAAADDGRIAFHGDVAGTTRDAFYDGLDVLVIPSEWEENAPLVAVEAAIRGLPAVVSDRGGLPETPEAEVFPAGDGGAFLAAVGALSARLEVASARLLARPERFLWSRHVAAVEAELESVAGWDGDRGGSAAPPVGASDVRHLR